MIPGGGYQENRRWVRYGGVTKFTRGVRTRYYRRRAAIEPSPKSSAAFSSASGGRDFRTPRSALPLRCCSTGSARPSPGAAPMSARNASPMPTPSPRAAPASSEAMPDDPPRPRLSSTARCLTSSRWTTSTAGRCSIREPSSFQRPSPSPSLDPGVDAISYPRSRPDTR